MLETFEIEAQSRSDVGKGASRRLRRQGKVPGVMYGGGAEPVALTLDHDDLMHHLENEAFYSHILTVKVDGEAQRAVLKDLQRHPAKPRVLHVDFQRVSDTDKIHMHVPLHFVGEDVAPGAKAGGLVSHLMTSVEVVCMAKDLPEYLEVDLSGLELGDSLHLSDIPLPQGVSLPALALGPEHDLPVVAIHAPKGGAAAEEGGEGEGEGGE